MVTTFQSQREYHAVKFKCTFFKRQLHMDSSSFKGEKCHLNDCYIKKCTELNHLDNANQHFSKHDEKKFTLSCNGLKRFGIFSLMIC